MMFWMIFLGVLILFGLACVFYLTRNMRSFRFVTALSRGRRTIANLIGGAAILIPLAIIWAAWGYMNAIIALLHLTLIWAICNLVQRIVRKLRGRAARRYYAGAAAILITVIYLGAGYVQANHVWQKNYALTTTKNIGSLRIALLADSHLGTTFDGEGLNKYIDQIQAQNPDIVLIAGDFVDEDSSKADMVAACRAVGRFDVPYGTYFVFGNHDKGNYSNGRRGYTGDDLIDELTKNGVTVLQDESVLIDDRFYLIGRQDASEELDFGGSRASIRDLAAATDPDVYSIVLDHQPRDYAAEAASNVDLVLSGHTHGGQMIPLVQLIRWFHIVDDNVYGLEHRKNTDFIVTSGISDWAIQFKTGCRSEYVIINVQGT